MDTEKELQGQACESGKADEQTCQGKEATDIPERDSNMEPQPYGLPGREPPPDETPPVSAFA